MATRKYVRKLQRVSTDSYTLNIPADVIEKFGWREKQKLEIIQRGRRRYITIKDWKK